MKLCNTYTTFPFLQTAACMQAFQSSKAKSSVKLIKTHKEIPIKH